MCLGPAVTSELALCVYISSPNVSIGLYLGVTSLFDLLVLFGGCNVNWTEAFTEHINTGNGLKWRDIYKEFPFVSECA